MSKLLECPFCGDGGDKGRMEVRDILPSGGTGIYFRIVCHTCGAWVPEANWNRRGGIDAQLEEAANR